MAQGVVPRPLWEKLLIPDAWAVSWQRKKLVPTLLGPPVGPRLEKQLFETLEKITWKERVNF